MSATSFQCLLITKEVPVCNSMYTKFAFLNKEWSGNKLMKGRRILDHCAIFLNSAQTKEVLAYNFTFDKTQLFLRKSGLEIKQ